MISALRDARPEDPLSPEAQDQPGQHSKTPSLQKKNKNCYLISPMWWHLSVILATWETEVEGSLEPRSLRLHCTMIVPLYSSLGDRVRPCLNENNNNEMQAGCGGSRL